VFLARVEIVTVIVSQFVCCGKTVDDSDCTWRVYFPPVFSGSEKEEQQALKFSVIILNYEPNSRIYSKFPCRRTFHAHAKGAKQTPLRPLEAKELQGMLEYETKAVIGISPPYGFAPGTRAAALLWLPCCSLLGRASAGPLAFPPSDT
jgi:hypothetical protein